MKRLLCFLSAVLLASLLCTSTSAAEVKLGTVNLKKVFDNYWKTKQADINLKEKAGEFDKKRKEYVDDYQKTNADYKKLLDGANDPAVSTEEREKRKKSAEIKLREIQEIEQSINQFDRSARAQLAELQRNMRDKIVGEIRGVLDTKARAGSFAYILDSSAESFTQTPVVLFSDGKNDLTDEVLVLLNATAPIGVLDAKPDDKKDGFGKDAKPPGTLIPPLQPFEPKPGKK